MSVIQATSVWTAAPTSIDWVRTKVRAAVATGQGLVEATAKALCPVRTGDLQASISSDPVEDDGQRVTGTISAKMPYSMYVEAGTGHRGEASAGAGPGPYSPTWPGMPAQPYLRPALDTERAGIVGAFSQ